MRARLIEQFKGLPNLDAFIKAYGNQLNDVEEFFGQLLTMLPLQGAVGAQLDRLGKALGQGRNGLSDENYQAILQARVIEYQSNGTLEDLIQILLAMGGAAKVQALEVFPAGVQIAAVGGSANPQDMTSAIIQAKGAGVRLTLLSTPSLPAFAYDTPVSADFAGYDAGHLSTVLH
jgi:hypothetical protein